MPNSPAPGQPPRSGLSLYANLLDPTGDGSISRGPVVFKNVADAAEETSVKKPHIDAAALRFQPTKRPQLTQKAKPKTFPKAPPAPDASKPSQASATAGVAAAKLPVKSTLADWTATGDDDDVNGFYVGEKRQRGGRKRRKKNKEEYIIAQDWDDIYDPSRPNNYEEYKHSEEKVREVTEWKDRLYAHRTARKASSDVDSDDEDYRPQMSNQFAPPTNYSFAPPPFDSPPKAAGMTEANPDEHAPTLAPSQLVPPPPPEDLPPQPPVPPSAAVPAATISRAPVRYNLPPAPSDIPSSEAELEKALADEPEDEEQPTEEAPRSLRPGQKGFAERLMSKYGWSRGTGLGADGSEKETEAGKFGPMSEVIVLRGMVDGMNLDEEVEGAGDGGLMQEIGDECAEKYGRVERVYIDRHGTAPKVFVKFTSQLSALRAVNALEGRIFNGNTIAALFYDSETFEQGVYE